MAKSMNKVIIMGNLTQAPEAKQLPSGVATARFSVALNRAYKDVTGELKTTVDYVNVKTWGKQAEQVAAWLDKGSRVLIEGRLENSTWEDKTTGQKRSSTDVLAENVTFLDSKPSEE